MKSLKKKKKKKKTYQRHAGKTGKMAKKFLGQGKHREFGNFVKTQGILLAQVVNVLILKVKDIAIVAAIKSFFFSRSWIALPST